MTMPNLSESGYALFERNVDPVARIRLISDDLHVIEQEINKTIKGIVLSKMSVCLALANIKINELYRQIGIKSFKQYLLDHRINIHYATASEYAKIGEIILKYRQKLIEIDFKEEDGLKKLLLLENAVNDNYEQRDFLFRKLKESSYREFQKIVKQNLQSARADSVNRAHYENRKFQFQLKIGEESIIVLPIDKEIVWFDDDIWKYLDTPELNRKFRKHIFKAVEDFFCRYC